MSNLFLGVPKYNGTDSITIYNYNDFNNCLKNNGYGGYLFYFSTTSEFAIFNDTRFAYVYAVPCHPFYPNVMTLIAFEINMTKIGFCEFVSDEVLSSGPSANIWRYIDTSPS